MTRTTARAAVGTASLLIKVDASGPWPDGSRTARAGTTPSGVPVTPGVVYDGSVKVRPENRPSPVRCELRWYRSDGTIIDTALGALSTEVAGQWTQRTCRAAAPPTAAYGGLRVYISNANYGDKHYVDDAWLTAASVTTTTTAPPATTTTKPPVVTTTTTSQPVTTTTTAPSPVAPSLLSTNQSSFETSTEGWVPQGNTTISRTTDVAAVGAASLRVAVDQLGPWPDGSGTARIGTTPGVEGIPVTPGAVYEGSVMVRADSRLSPVRCELRWYDAGGSIIDTSFGTLSSEVAGQWTQRLCRAAAPTGAAFAGLRVYISDASYGDIHYVDQASLTKVSVTTTSTTAPTPTTAAPQTTTTTTPSAPTTTVPIGSSTTTYPGPGTVGFRGDPGTLKVLDGSSAVPAGTSWNHQYNYLQVDTDNLILDGYYVKGGIDYYGRGTLTVRNSIIEGGWGSWFVVMGRTSGGTMDVRDTTLRWRAGSTPSVGGGNGALQIAASVKIISIRNDISGTADGIQLAGDDSRVEQTWIHDLATVGEYPNNTHNDGIQIYDGERIVILNNRIEIGFDGVHQNAALFFQPGDGNSVPGVQIVGNYLQGGGFTLRLEGPTTGAIVNNNTFGPLGEGWGYSYSVNGASISQWTNNFTTSGASVGMP